MKVIRLGNDFAFQERINKTTENEVANVEDALSSNGGFDQVSTEPTGETAEQATEEKQDKGKKKGKKAAKKTS